jgi:hypothetical protein
MKQQEPILIPDDGKAGATSITREVLTKLIGKEAVDAGEKRFTMTHVGPWNICKTITGLAMTCKFGAHSSRKGIILFGDRTMTNPTESGYEMEGRVSIKGKKYRTFTSSTMFELEDKKLVNVATLFVCGYYKE